MMNERVSILVLVLLLSLLVFETCCGLNVARWMEDLGDLIAEETVFEVSLPGAHDSMTGDSSRTVALNYDVLRDVPGWAQEILHWISPWLPTSIMRDLSMTQKLLMTGLLNAGIRHIDFRITFTDGEWKSVHFVQTKHSAFHLLEELCDWLVLNPHEVVLLKISNHGNLCDENQFQNIPQEKRRAFWDGVRQLFGELLFDHRENRLNETKISELLRTNQRLIAFIADFHNFTHSGENRVENGCGRFVSADLLSVLENGRNGFERSLLTMRKMKSTRNEAKAQNKLVSQVAALSMNSEGIGESVACRMLGICQRCFQRYAIPDSTFCPPSLPEVGFWNNYFLAKVFNSAASSSFGHVILVDGIDAMGAIQTDEAKDFAFVPRVLLSFVEPLCESKRHKSCQNLQRELQEQIRLFPLRLEDDLSRGRISDWP